jgi:hypothetical protein
MLKLILIQTLTQYTFYIQQTRINQAIESMTHLAEAELEEEKNFAVMYQNKGLKTYKTAKLAAKLPQGARAAKVWCLSVGR